MHALRSSFGFAAVLGLLGAASAAWAQSGPPTVNANVVNTPDVNVVNTPDVNILNVRTPILLFSAHTIPAATLLDSENMRESALADPFLVPDGMQLVIEYVGMTTGGVAATLAPGEVYQGSIRIGGGSQFLVGTVRGDEDLGGESADSGEHVQIRIPEGNNVNFIVEANSPGLEVIADISGYLEPM